MRYFKQGPNPRCRRKRQRQEEEYEEYSFHMANYSEQLNKSLSTSKVRKKGTVIAFQANRGKRKNLYQQIDFGSICVCSGDRN